VRPSNKTLRLFTVLVASKLTRKIVPSVVEEISNLPSTSRLRSRIPAGPTPAPFRYEVLNTFQDFLGNSVAVIPDLSR